MKERILTGWDFKRFIYLLIGLGAITMGVIGKDWMVGIVGSYFASMAIFSFGCAAGNCFNRSCPTALTDKSYPPVTEEIPYEEIH